MLRGELRKYFARAVIAHAIHDDQLDPARGPLGVEHALNDVPDVGCLVAAGNDYRNERCGNRWFKARPLVGALINARTIP